MRSIFVLGLLMGLRHAFEADHLAAVATLATRSRSLRAGVLQGAAWGLGHSLTLLLVGGTCLLLGRAVPEHWAAGLELAVGLMLLWLGADLLLRARRARLHLHTHSHGAGDAHFHAHSHAPEAGHDPAQHRHEHRAGLPGRALAVGLMHGLAGSAALLLLTLQHAPSVLAGLAYIGLFGLGSTLGMALLSVAIAVPLQLSARRLAGVQAGLELLVGLLTLGIGLRMVYQLVS